MPNRSTSTFRIPAAPITGLRSRVVAACTRRAFGQVPDTVRVLLHHRRVLRAVLGFESRVARWDRLDADLKAYAQLAGAGVIECSWCLDFGTFLSQREGLDEAKLREVPRWHDSEAFTPLERDVMAYAEAMSTTPPTVTDDLAALLLDRLGAEVLVELTQVVALENMRSRFNSAAGLVSQGFSEHCDLPPARPAGPDDVVRSVG